MTNKYAKFSFGDVYLKVSVLLSLLLFVFSLNQEAFYLGDRDDSVYSSVFVFCFGWGGFLAGNFFTSFIWFANPLYILAILLSGFNKKKSALAVSICAVVLALCFLAVDAIATSESGNGPFYKIILGTGYWIWLAAIVVLTFGNVMSYLNYKNRSA